SNFPRAWGNCDEADGEGWWRIVEVVEVAALEPAARCMPGARRRRQAFRSARVQWNRRVQVRRAAARVRSPDSEHARTREDGRLAVDPAPCARRYRDRPELSAEDQQGSNAEAAQLLRALPAPGHRESPVPRALGHAPFRGQERESRPAAAPRSRRE